MTLANLVRNRTVRRACSLGALLIAGLVSVILLSSLWTPLPSSEQMTGVRRYHTDNSGKSVLFGWTWLEQLTGVRRYHTDNSDKSALPGWTWLVNEANIALGITNEGVLQDFQYKIHFLDEAVGVWGGGEFFCDPDDILFIPTTGEVAYLPYLAWQRDLSIDEAGTSGHLSLAYQPNHSAKEAVLDVSPLATDVSIRIDKTILSEGGFIDSQVYITNHQDAAIDIVYITQDAAYMFLPDGDQAEVAPVTKSGAIPPQPAYSYGSLKSGDIVATYHEDKDFVGGYVVKDDASVWGGVVPEYAFFVTHAPSEIIPGFADVAQRSFDDVEAINTYFNALNSQWDWGPDGLKNRILIFSFEDVKPGETVTADFYQFGARHIDAMNSQMTQLF